MSKSQHLDSGSKALPERRGSGRHVSSNKQMTESWVSSNTNEQMMWFGSTRTSSLRSVIRDPGVAFDFAACVSE